MFNEFFETWKNVNSAIQFSREWRDIVFYSEGPWITNHLNPIIKNLTDSRNKKVTLLTSSKVDHIEIKNIKNLKIIFIGNQSARTYLFRKFRTNLMIMSTPNLQSMQLKREVNSRYFYTHHSPVSTHMIYQENAYDDFDGMFCVGPHHVKEVEEREEKLSLKKKILLKSGFPNFDNLSQIINAPEKKKSILLAPSWGDNSIINICLYDLISKLIELNYKVILRPHNMSYKKNKKKLSKAINNFKQNKLFTLDEDPNSYVSMKNTDLLITDWSGIAFECLIIKKPIIFIDTPPKVNNKNYKIISEIPIEVSMREKIGEIIALDEINKLSNTSFKEKIVKANNKISKNKDFISENFYNFGKSINVISDQIEKLSKEIN